MTLFSLKSSAGWPLAPAIATACLLPVAFWLDGPGPAFASQLMPWWLAALTTVLVLLGARRIPVPFTLWWLWGACTLAWSLAPGHTLLWTLWTVLYAAAFVAGRWRYGLWLLSGAVAANYLLKNLSGAGFGIAPMYTSGSNLYVGGAVALPLVAGLLWLLARAPANHDPTMAGQASTLQSRPVSPRALWLLTVLGLGVSLYAVGISGARSVYLPLAAVLLGAVCLLALRDRSRLWPLLGSLGAAGLLATSLNFLLPGRLLLSALNLKGTVAAQLAATDAGGNLQTRLQMWELNTHMAAVRPFGTGGGSYAQVMSAFHDWPVYFSRFPHSVYFEQLSATGWVGLILLVWLLWQSARAAWRARRWAALLAVGALWLHLGFDITSDMPVLMMLAVAALGACYGEVEQVGISSRSRVMPWTGLGPGLLAVAASIWWFWPCHSAACLVRHQLGFTAPSLTDLSPDTPEWQTIKRLYPRSAWVDGFLLSHLPPGDTLAERRAILARMVDRYPALSMHLYTQLAQTYLASGNPETARETLRRGVAVFTRPRSFWGLALQVPPQDAHEVAAAKAQLSRY